MQINKIKNVHEMDKLAYNQKMQWIKRHKVFGLGFITFLILINPFFACTNVNTPFYEKVLNDFDSSSYFIALNLKTPTFKGRAIVENNDLYQFLNKTKGLNKVKYIAYMQRILARHRAIKLSDMDLITWKFKKVSLSSNVIHNAEKGMDNFVAYYFTGTMFNDMVTEEERNAVIDQLFYWEYPAKIDKTSGELIIG